MTEIGFLEAGAEELSEIREPPVGLCALDIGHLTLFGVFCIKEQCVRNIHCLSESLSIPRIRKTIRNCLIRSLLLRFFSWSSV